MLKRLMPQRLRNWWGDIKWPSDGGGSHCYCRCDNCGNTFWRNRKGSYSVYTKERLPKPGYWHGTSHWAFCVNCPPSQYIPSELILRIYRSDGEPADLRCVDCGRFHPANVCYSTHSEAEVRVQGRGFPITIGPRDAGLTRR